ncbi:MAG: thioredoxin family protein [Spirochaetales bacterium]|nr:thioredoxin family protein [Spirochaetales bacterium]
MTIQVLGSGCPSCQKLKAHAQEAIATLGWNDVEISKVADMNTIMEMGVMLTPALAVDDEVLSSGKILSVQDIISLLQEKQK